MENDIFGDNPVEQKPTGQEEAGGTDNGAGASDQGNAGADAGDKGADKGTDDKGDGKGGDGNDKGKDNLGDIDIQNHPVVVALNEKIRSLGGNLGGQGKVIKDLENKLKLAQSGGNIDDKGVSTLFTEIKTSKDLTKDERDEMSETELKQFDEIATLKQGMNKLAELIGGTKKADEAKDGEDDDLTIGTQDNEPVTNFKKDVQSIALEVAGNDTEMANKIIFEFNQFAGNELLNKAQLKERITKSASLVSGYKPPKEQPIKRGKGVDGNKDKDDAFGVNAIVENARKANTGSYTL